MNAAAFRALSVDDADYIDQESTSSETTSSSTNATFDRCVNHSVKYKKRATNPWDGAHRDVYVRVLFNFDPTHELGMPAPGLALSRGSIIKIQTNVDFSICSIVEDREMWWQATMIMPSTSSTHDSRFYSQRGQSGLVPSRFRQESRVQRRKAMQVRFQRNRPHRHSGVMNSLIRRMKRASSAELLNNKVNASPTRRQLTASTESLCTIGAAPVSYIPVELAPVPHERPVILLGAAVDQVAGDIIWLYPHVFRRPNERETERTSFVRRHPVMCHSLTGPDSLDRALQLVTTHAKQYPIVLLTRPLALEQLHMWLYPSPLHRELSTAEELHLLNVWRQIIDMENALAAQITDIVTSITPNECAKLVLSCVRMHAQSLAWLPIDNSQPQRSAPKETTI